MMRVGEMKRQQRRPNGIRVRVRVRIRVRVVDVDVDVVMTVKDMMVFHGGVMEMGRRV